jgi:hypothetical protein
MNSWRLIPGVSLILFITITLLLVAFGTALSFDGRSKGFDRFYAKCPADGPTIRRFDPSLAVEHDGAYDGDEDETWVAVFRSNIPSILPPLEFTTTAAITNHQQQQSSAGLMIETTETPVAVGRLRKLALKQKWVMDSLRCSLKKENTNKHCDGGSEHAEAISVCVDELLLHYLKQQKPTVFESSIRCKATLVSGPILENRGFTPVQELSRDMATHVASLGGSLGSYATRASDVNGIVWNSGPLIRDRTLQIVSLLSSLDRSEQGQTGDDNDLPLKEDDDSDESYDPWAAVKRYI